MRLRQACLLACSLVAAMSMSPASAQLITGGESLIQKYNPLRPYDPHQSVDVIELSKAAVAPAPKCGARLERPPFEAPT